MTLVSDLRYAYRNVSCRAEDLPPDEAARVGMDVRQIVTRLEARYQGTGLWRALFTALRGEVVVAALLGAVLVAVSPVVPWLVGRVIGGAGWEWALGLTAATLSYAALGWASTWRVRRLILLIDLSVQRLVFRRLAVTDPAWTSQRKRSSLTHLLVYGQQLSQIAFLVEVTIYGVQIVLLAGFLLVAYGLIAIPVLAAVVVLSVAVERIDRLVGRVWHRYSELDHERTALLDAVIRHWQSIRRQYLEGPVLAALRDVRRRQVGVVRRRAVRNTLSYALTDTVPMLVSLVAVGAALLAGHAVRAAGVFGMLVVVRMMLAGLGTIMASYGSLRTAVETTREIDRLVTDAPALADPRTAGAPGAITLTPRTGGPIRIAPGERIAVIGRPGAGKTTLLQRLAAEGPSSPQPWHVTRSGDAILVGRNEPLFDGPVAETVTGWAVDVDEDRYRDALRRSGLADDLADRPGGDAAMLSATDVRLSEGQMARVSLARAWYADTNVLLLDDIFAPLDPDRAIRVAADVLGPDGPTRVFTTSRLELVRHADRVILVDHDTLACRLPGDLATADAERILGADLHRQLHTALSTTAGTPARSARMDGVRRHAFGSEPRPALATVDAGSAPARASSFFRNGLAIFPAAMLGVLLVSLCAAVIADLTVSGLVDHGSTRLPLFVGAAVVAVMAALARYAITYGSPIRATDRLHELIAVRVLSRRVDDRRDLLSGRLGTDFFALEIYTPQVFGTLAAVAAHTAGALAVLIAAAPVTALFLLPLSIAGVGLVRRARPAMTDGANLAATVRGAVLTFGAAALATPTYRRSTPLRRTLSDRFDALGALRGTAMYRLAMSRLRILLSVRALGTVLFLAALWAGVALRGWGIVGAGMVIYIAYTFGEQIAASVERLQTADQLNAQLGRLSDLLDLSALPPAAETRGRTGGHEPLAALLTDDGSTEPVGLVEAADLIVTSPDGRQLSEPLTLSIPPGARVVVRGPSGVGKSTFVHAIAHSGDQPITVDGQLTDPFSTRTRRSLALVDSDLPPLGLTVAELMPHGGAALGAVYRAAGQESPDPDTSLSDLSHGNRQLVNLARALTTRRPIYILDEATSALDPATERRVLTALPRLTSGATIIVVLHRLDNQDLFPAVLDISPARSPAAADRTGI